MKLYLLAKPVSLRNEGLQCFITHHPTQHQALQYVLKLRNTCRKILAVHLRLFGSEQNQREGTSIPTTDIWINCISPPCSSACKSDGSLSPAQVFVLRVAIIRIMGLLQLEEQGLLFPRWFLPSSGTLQSLPKYHMHENSERKIKINKNVTSSV